MYDVDALRRGGLAMQLTGPTGSHRASGGLAALSADC